MLDVNVEKILPVTEVRDSLNKIIDEVESTDELYVVTKNGKPAAIVVGVHHLEKLTGINHSELMPDETPLQGETPTGSAPAGGALGDDTTATTQNSAIPADDTTTPTANITPAATDTTDPFKTPDIAENATVNPSPADNTFPAASTPLADQTAPTQTQTEALPIAASTAPAANTAEAPADDADDIFGPIDEPDLEAPASSIGNTTPPASAIPPAETAQTAPAVPNTNATINTNNNQTPPAIPNTPSSL